MKKLLSIVLAAIMTVSVLAAAAIPALAVESPTATTAANKGPITQVNGTTNDKDIQYTPDKNNPNVITFVYTGEGTLEGWIENMEDLGFVYGTDFTAVENPDGSFTITFISKEAQDAFKSGDVIVNALVKFASTTKADTTKKNDSSKSPGTGVATSVIAGSVAVAGAGFAVLSATKKRDAE